jgi:hypothetical protein
VVHLLVAPYTKVEESFNIQATHDILVYGTPTSHVHEKLLRYDHFEFPGAVPRTFVGSLLLGGVAQPFVTVLGFRYAQFIARALLGLVNAASLLAFKRAIAREYGQSTARWYLLLQASQFHVLYYASRTLPNMFAFGLSKYLWEVDGGSSAWLTGRVATLAFAQLVGKTTNANCRLAIALLTCATAVFRSELAILLTTTTLCLLATKRTSIDQIIRSFVGSCLFALAISVPIDSYFWQKPLWPELWGFYYNAILGSSSEWGVSPWYYYLVNALPKLLINPLAILFLIPLALSMPATRPGAMLLSVPSLLFVAIYSIQPHKEARFIYYVVPPLTATAALGANYVFTRRTKSAVHSHNDQQTEDPPAAYAEITRVCTANAIPQPEQDIAKHLFQIASAAQLSREYSRRQVAAACIFTACRQAQAPRTLQEIETASGVPKKDIAHLSKKLTTLEETQKQANSLGTLYRLGSLALVLSILLSFAISTAMLLISSLNYPGGEALSQLRTIIEHDIQILESKAILVHTDVLSCMTGVTLFGQHPESPTSPWGPVQGLNVTFDKTEKASSLRSPAFWTKFDYVLAEDAHTVIGRWETVGVVEGYAGIEVLKPGAEAADQGLQSGRESGTTNSRVLGAGATVKRIRDLARSYTGGWWIGPRMLPRISILRRVRGLARKEVTS